MRALGRGSLASYIKIALLVVWGALWFAAACLLIGVLAYGAVLILIQTGMLDAKLLEPGDTTQTYGPVTIVTETDDRLTWHVMVPAFLAGAVAISGALVIVQRLRRLFASFTTGDPFSRDNATHLRVIWITMLVMELSRHLISNATKLILLVFGQPENTEVNVGAPINWLTWGAILVLIVLAEVFREGARLREEQDLTI